MNKKNIYLEAAFDARELSENAFLKMQEFFNEIGYHLGDAETEYYGEQMSDSWFLYLKKRKMSKKDLFEAFFSQQSP